MHIALLGGSFDPPHLGHLSVARQIKHLLPIDEVWLIPCFQHAFHKKLTDASHRLEMTRLLATDKIKISDLEMKRKGVSITSETLDSFKKAYPNNIFSWVIGDDQVKDFHKWDEWERIVQDYKLIIVPRSVNTIDLSKYFPNRTNITYLTSDSWQISTVSSTEIRKRVREGKAIDQLVPKKIERYIIVHGLYK